MIEILRQSLEEGKLPFGFADDIRDYTRDWHDYTNAFVKYEPERRGLLASPERDHQFGRLGTIGLHMVANLDFDLDEASKTPPPEGFSEITFDHHSVAQSFLWAGRCPRGTRFRLRMSDPTVEHQFSPWVPRCAELVIDDDLVIRFEETSDRWHFGAACSRAFWPSCEPRELTELAVAQAVAQFELLKFMPTNICGPNGEAAFDLQEQFCTAAVVRIRQLLAVALCGIFCLRAIRPIQRQIRVDPADLNDERIIGRRWVGQGGENTHALARRFAFNVMKPAAGSGDGRRDYRFETYYNVWLKKLLGTSGDSELPWTDAEDPPSGYLGRFCPDDERVREWVSEDEVEHELGNLNIYTSPLFGEYNFAAPVHMSSGFHQIAPMVVQAGLMKANEVLCIENPEVHLHPKLQLEIAEFLLRQAEIGKYMIIETHSDLVVRRVMRAVLAEELKQEAVRLYFTRVDTESEFYREPRVASSVLERVEIDERGQIRNWPEGFLDADIRESRRLLDVMYGSPIQDVEEDEEESP
jgi:hypothetical protein